MKLLAQLTRFLDSLITRFARAEGAQKRRQKNRRDYKRIRKEIEEGW
jgi:hypothetical protein